MSKALENISYEELLETNKKLQSEKSQLESAKSSLESKVAQLQFQIDQMNRLLYGSKRERFIKGTDENQMTLPFDVPEDSAPEKQEETITYVRKKAKRVNHPGRMALPDHLPVEEIIIEPEEDTTGMKCIGKEVTDQLELVPAKLFIKRYIRPKYITQENTETLEHKGVIAPLPTFPIEKGMAGAGLLAQIMVDKFVDHLPIYRQVERFKREGIKISSSTINGWQESVASLLWPLYETLKDRVFGQGYIQADETPIPVLDKTKKGKTHKGYHWIYHSPLEKTVFFDYQHGRSQKRPAELLKGFKGYLQTDGYVVYDLISKSKDITHLNCMAQKVVSRAVYNILAINKEGRKELIGMYISESEGANFWLSVLTDLKNRGVNDILIACTDNLKGFSEAILSIFPETEIQKCVIHQIRNSLKYVASKDQKSFMKDLKKVYQSPTKSQAETELLNLEEIWGKKYPIVIRSWNENWEELTTYFQYDTQVRKLIYTTNPVEGFHRQVRKVTKTKGAFPTDMALLKLIYLATENISKKWTQPLQNWGLTIQQLCIKFGDRMKIEL